MSDPDPPGPILEEDDLGDPLVLHPEDDGILDRAGRAPARPLEHRGLRGQRQDLEPEIERAGPAGAGSRPRPPRGRRSPIRRRWSRRDRMLPWIRKIPHRNERIRSERERQERADDGARVDRRREEEGRGHHDQGRGQRPPAPRPRTCSPASSDRRLLYIPASASDSEGDRVVKSRKRAYRPNPNVGFVRSPAVTPRAT